MKNKPKLKIDKFGNKFWYLNGKLHRIEYLYGTKYWYLNGKRHRIDGPAIEYSNGVKGWYLNGKQVNKEDVIINAILTEREYIKFILKRLS